MYIYWLLRRHVLACLQSSRMCAKCPSCICSPMCFECRLCISNWNLFKEILDQDQVFWLNTILQTPELSIAIISLSIKLLYLHYLVTSLSVQLPQVYLISSSLSLCCPFYLLWHWSGLNMLHCMSLLPHLGLIFYSLGSLN